MEKFFALSEEKQTTIRNAALACLQNTDMKKRLSMILHRRRAFPRHPCSNILAANRLYMSICSIIVYRK